jgi:diguanylate cyclase (GGDEF)-like protein/PAS domain S-box-containing protein
MSTNTVPKRATAARQRDASRLRIRILLLEDVTTTAEIMKAYLRSVAPAATVELAGTLGAALQKLAAGSFDLILADLNLPDSAGLATLDRLLEATDRLIIVLTVEEEQGIRDAALARGAYDFVHKSRLNGAALARVVRFATIQAETFRSLREGEARFRSLAKLSSDFYWETDARHRIVRMNTGLDKPPGHLLASQLGKTRWEIPTASPDEAGWAAHRAVLAAHLPFRDFEFSRVNEKGVERFLSISGEPVFDESGAFSGYRGVGRNFTERKLQQRKIERLSRMHAVLSGLSAVIVRARSREEVLGEACRVAVEAGGFRIAWIGLLDGEKMRVLPVAWQGPGRELVENVDINVGDGAPARGSPLGQAIREGRAVVSNDIEHDARIVLKSQLLAYELRSMAVLPLQVAGETIGALTLVAGETDFFDDEEVTLLAGLAGDISFALDHLEKEKRLDYLALYDSLTGLANRTLFLERLNQSIHAAAQLGGKLPIVLADIERFRTVNDSLGRQAGDALLKQAAGRFARAAGRSEVARIGADQFAVVLEPVRGRSEAGRNVQAMARECFNEPFTLSGGELRTSAKAGIALYPHDGTDAETLLKHAEAALRRSKDSGEPFVFYTPALTEWTAATLTLENKLRQALKNAEFVLHYQAKVDCETRRIVGVEALIRWQSPELGLVPPMKFIPLMEETGLILEAGAWALRQAVADHGRWRALGLAAPPVAVNVSPIQLRRKDFVATIEAALRGAAATPCLDLELTESLIMQDIEGNIRKLDEVGALGVRVAIDDFGTGYSSLAYLAKLPVQSLKIDRSFIVTMLKDAATMTLVQTIITLARSLKLKVVAEGVEAEEQAKVLRLLRCDEFQGYLFSKPLPFEALTALLRAG